jgi:predicted HNH restriction endonuclease
MAGRRTKATDARKDALLSALRAGNTRQAAAAFAEIDRATFYRWINADAAFRDTVEKAEADAEVRFASHVARAATNGTWQAAAWWLERLRPNDFALRNRVEMTGKDGGPIESVNITNDLSPEVKRRLRDRLARAVRSEVDTA